MAMDKIEFRRRFLQLPPVERKRVLNTIEYLDKFLPMGEELHSILQGLSPEARQLLHDMLLDKEV